ncbi:MAG: tripartite tricarboxylate transporter permease [Anaerolineaceae bacterium]|nr:tripartite tricarboxylate transporter permease [Anaerolineaceae bacterium]
MDILNFLLEGFAIALTPLNIFMAFAGTFIGTMVGMLPGIGPVNGVVVLIPLTYALGLPPESALIMFAGIYYGSQYGNSISAILLNVPGTSSAVMTALEGNAMTKKGRAGPALAMSAIASFFGGTVSVVALMLFAPALARWAIRFGPAEYFALMVFAFSTLSSLSGKNIIKGLLATLMGLMLATVGLDPVTAVDRYTFGQLKLLDGLDFVVVVIGFFAINEIFRYSETIHEDEEVFAKLGRVMITAKEFAMSFWTMVRGAIIGFFVGVLPGAGGTIASFVAYTTEQRLVDRKGTFGTGDIRGVAAPEAANNASANGAMIPLLTLGVPGSETTAVMLGALLGMNITPGPLFISNNPHIFWSLIASMYVGNVMLLLLNLPFVGLFVKILKVPSYLLMPGVVAVSFVAVYSVNNSPFDIFLMAGFGLMGYVLHKTGFPLASVILGLVLGPLVENNLRRAMSLSDGDWTYLFSSPIAIGLWIAAIASLFLPLIIKRFSAASTVADEMEEVELVEVD